MHYIRLHEHDPARNLALEEALFWSLHEGGDSYFLLWQNGPSVILGRHQNALEEVNRDEVQLRHLPVVRRSTGGGAVYHDLGNLNFSFLEFHKGASGVDFGRYLAPIVEALKKAGVEAEISGRNDLEVGGRKISGSAQRLAQGRVLHHGTLLVSANFEDMTRALHPDPEKFMSHGVASVRARVANIDEFWTQGLDLEHLCDLLADSVGARPGHIPQSVTEKAQELYETRYGLWEWNIGSSPRCTARTSRRFPWGRVEVVLDIQKGCIAGCRIYGDFFSVEDVGQLEQILTGSPLERKALEKRLAGCDLGQWFSGCDPDEVRNFLLDL